MPYFSRTPPSHAAACGHKAGVSPRAVLALYMSIASLGYMRPAKADPGHQALGGHCDNLEITCEHASCQGLRCQCTGDASVICGEARLFADAMTLWRGHDGRFMAATAQGNVIFVTGLKILRAQELSFVGDALTGRIDDAQLCIKRDLPPPSLDAKGLPCGPNAVTIKGSLRASGRQRFTLEGASFTLCDCGAAPPSWRLEAPAVFVRPQRRATLLWPQLSISFFGQPNVVVTPPLLPLSVPLRPRAWGLLPPRLQFLGPPWPTVDVPLFVPLGPSYDVTLTPGWRGDWGAPRLAGRFRYAPFGDMSGEAKISWTHDGGQRMAKRAMTLASPALLAQQGAAYVEALNQERLALTERIAIDVSHRSVFFAARLEHASTYNPDVPMLAKLQQKDAVSLQLDASWTSDDLVNRDFMIAPQERAATYLPNRAALLWRRPGAVASLSIDGMLRLDSTRVLTDGTRVPWLSNVRGAEQTTLHRLPALTFDVLPFLAWPHVSIDAQASFSRFATLASAPAVGEADRRQNVMGARGGVSIFGNICGIKGRARLGVDIIGFDVAAIEAANNSAQLSAQQQRPQLAGDIMPFVDVKLQMPRARTFQNVRHSITPTLDMLGLLRPMATSQALVAGQLNALDETLVRRLAWQLSPGLRQSWWRKTTLGVSEIGRLEVMQPIDLLYGQLLQLRGALRLFLGAWGTTELQGTLDWHALKLAPLRETLARYSNFFGPLWFEVAYTRLAPDADRFQRSIYELAAAGRSPLPISADQWAHYANLVARINLLESLNASYMGTYQLHRPGREAGMGEPACSVVGGRQSNACFVAHTLTVRYASRCNCWGVEAIVSFAPQDVSRTLRMLVLLDVAGMRLGSTGV